MLNVNNPLDFTARDFSSIYLDLKSKYPNRPDWFMVILAGLFDNAHFYLDARAQDTVLETARSTESILNLAAFLDYYRNPQTAAEGVVLVKINHANITSYPHTIFKEDLNFVVLPFGGGQVPFYALNDISIPSASYDYIEVPVRHGVRVNMTEIGFTDGLTPWQELVLPFDDIQLDTLELYNVIPGPPVVYDLWVRQDTLVNSQPTDKHYRVITRSNNTYVIRFGNNVYGAIPSGLFVAKFCRFGGIRGNVSVKSSNSNTVLLGVSDGSPNQTFNIAKDISPSTIRIVINFQYWTRVANFVNTGGENVFRVVRLPNGDQQIQFSDGINGNIPPNAANITMEYRLADNVRINYNGALQEINQVLPVNDFTGGSLGESLDSVKILAPQMTKVQNRAVIEDDYVTLSLRFNPNIKQVNPLPGYYGFETIGIHIVPSGGGYASASLKQSLQDYLIMRSTLRSMDVRVRDPIYVPEDVSATLFLKPGSNVARNTAYGLLAIRLLLSETTKEIVDLFKGFGIERAVEFINTKWSFAPYFFNAVDYGEITKIISRRIRDGVPTFGTPLRPNDIISAMSDLNDFDYATVSVPANIVPHLFDQIMTDGNITLNVVVP